MDFPTLYKQNKNGKWQTWNVKVAPCSADDGFVIRRTYGLEEGKTTVSEKKVIKGKNIGKANVTSAFQQACNEATALLTNYKTTHGYTETKATTTNAFRAMLAHVFSKHAKKIVFPAFAQPKLDGVRFIVDSNAICYSRTGRCTTPAH